MLKKLDSRAICFTEARKIFEDRKISELSDEQKQSLDYLRTMPKISYKETESCKQELQAIEGLKDHQMASLMSLFPKNEDEIKAVFAKERINLTKDQISKILEALDKVRPDKK